MSKRSRPGRRRAKGRLDGRSALPERGPLDARPAVRDAPRRSRPARLASVGLATAGQTVVSLMLRPVGEGDPWPLTRVLTALSAFDVERAGVARALGDRRGIPLIHSQQLRWGEVDVFVEARHGRDGLDELSVELPPWDDVIQAAGDELAWGFLDTVAAAADARFGSIGDGEPPETEPVDGPAVLERQLRRHLALLLPEWTAEDADACGATIRRQLPSSGLMVVTS
jgi:hypothetical protein